jgi:hypothetical protein
MNNKIGRTILAQIPMGLQMALGVRAVFLIDKGLRFNITGTRAVFVEITLNGADLYDMVAYTMRKPRGEFLPVRKVRYEIQDVDAGQMVDILDLMDKGAITL